MSCGAQRRQLYGPVRRGSAGVATHSRHRGALQISANCQGARVDPSHVGNGCIKIELTDVTDYQSPNSRLLGDTPDDRRWSVKSACRTGSDGEMHDEDIRTTREIDEP